MKKYISLLKLYYPEISNAFSIKQTDIGHEKNSKNFVISLSNRKSFVLKESVVNERIRKGIEMLEKCFLSGIRVPETIRTKDGLLWVEINNRIYSLYRFYEGKQFSGSAEQVCDAARHLALLHKFLKRQNIRIKPNPMYDFLDNNEIRNIESKIKNAEFDLKVRRLLKDLHEFYENANKDVAGLKFPRQLIHGDFIPENTLFRNGELLVFFDFGSIYFSERIADVAFSCHRFARVMPDMEKCMKMFLDSYSTENHLYRKEIRAVPFFIKREVVRRINYILRSHFFENKKEWDFELDKHINILKEMENMEWSW